MSDQNTTKAITLIEEPADHLNDIIEAMEDAGIIPRGGATVIELTEVVNCACGDWGGMFCDCSGIDFQYEGVKSFPLEERHYAMREKDSA